MEKLILCIEHGNYNLYDGTYENAFSILENYCDNMPNEFEIINNFKGVVISEKQFIKTIEEILSKNVGDKLIYLSEINKKEIKNTQEMKYELKDFMFNNNIAKNNIAHIVIFINDFQNSLTWLKENNIKVFSDVYLDGAHKLNVIINNRWKNTASEYQKIQYVLDFINVWLVDNEVKLLLVEKNEEY